MRKKFLSILGYDVRDYWVIIVYSAVIGLLTLALPIAVSYFVNSIGFLGTLQPIIVVTIILFALLSFSAFLNIMQIIAAEIFERRAYARLTEGMALTLPYLDNPSKESRSHLSNRFLEILNIQKALNSLLIEGLGLALQTVAGLILLSFYHPYFIGFNLMMMGFFWGLYRICRGDSFERALDESKAKYKLFSWLQQIGRYPHLFSARGAQAYAEDTCDQHLNSYMDSRRSYYQGIVRQNIGLGLFYALGSAAFLGVCGWLVLKAQLSIGQLVAAEIILTGILIGVWKFGTKIETIDKFLVAIYKLDDLFSMNQIKNEGYSEAQIGREISGELNLNGVGHKYSDFTMTYPEKMVFSPGSRSLLVARRGLGKSTLARILNRDIESSMGRIELDGIDYRDLKANIYRNYVHVISQLDFFDGTIEENLKIYNARASLNDLRAALESVGAETLMDRLDHGFKTNIFSCLHQLSKSDRLRLILAREFIGQPKVLVIDGVLDLLNETAANQICRRLCDPSAAWTLLILSDRHLDRSLFNQVVEF